MLRAEFDLAALFIARSHISVCDMAGKNPQERQ